MVDAPRTAIIRSWRRVAASKDFLLPAAAATGLIAGGALELAGAHTPASAIWAATTLALLVPLTISVGRSLIRGDVGVDAIALIAMAGALALGEALAGAVIALMLAGGNALEVAADRRARSELTALLARSPTSASATRSRRSTSPPWPPATSWSSARARSCRSTGPWSRRSRSSTSRR